MPDTDLNHTGHNQRFADESRAAIKYRDERIEALEEQVSHLEAQLHVADEMEPADELLKRTISGIAFKYRNHRIGSGWRRPFWSVVGEYSGHGSGFSNRICQALGFDSHTGEELKDGT